VLFHHFDRFLIEYESRFEREYGFFRFHPHLHFLVTEGGMDAAGVFQKIPRIDDSRLAEIFAREVLGFLVAIGSSGAVFTVIDSVARPAI
jgi:hypothetical protein